MNTNRIQDTIDSNKPISFVRLPIVLERLGVSKATFYRWIQEGNAPQPTKVGQRLSLWRRDEIDELTARIAQGRVFDAGLK